MKKALDYIKYILIIISVSLTFYYYVYLWFINTNSHSGKKIILNEKNIIVEDVEPLYDIQSVLNELNTDFSTYFKTFLIKKTRGTTMFELKIKDTTKINEMLGAIIFNPTLNNSIRLTILHGVNMNNFTITWKINDRNIYLSGEFDSNYIYFNKVILNGMFSMINQWRLDLFLDEIGGYIDYSTLTNIKTDNFNLNLIDEKIGKSKKDLFITIIIWVGEVFNCNKLFCKLIITDKSSNEMMKLLLSNNRLSNTQKSTINALSSELIKHLNWTSITFGKKGYTINSTNKTLIFDLFYDYTDTDIIYLSNTDRTKYKKVDFDDMVKSFEWQNKLFMSIISNKEEVVPLILKNN